MKSHNNWNAHKKKEEEYDYVDSKGKGWRKKQGETMTELKQRVQGGKKNA